MKSTAKYFITQSKKHRSVILISDYHIWSVSYNGDRLYLDISHGVTDGTAMYMVLATLLFYYCNERYGVADSTGICTLEDEITPDETIDPYDLVPMLDPSKLPAAGLEPAFSLAEDTDLKPCEPLVCDIELPEKEFVDFCFANEASPGTMVCVLFARAIDTLYPKKARDIRNSYIVNARPMSCRLSDLPIPITSASFRSTNSAPPTAV